MAYHIDQQSMLDLRKIIQVDGQYVYLEIGSETGQGLTSVLADPHCSAVLSVDLRPQSTPDERGRTWEYGVTTLQMLDYLALRVRLDDMKKLWTFEADTEKFVVLVDRLHAKVPTPNLVFLDAEHTNAAVFQDFLNIYPLLPSDCIFAGHDANLIFDGVVNIEAMLKYLKIPFHLAYLPDVVFAFAFGKYIEPVKALPHWDPKEYLRYARQTLNDEIVMNAATRPRIENTGVLCA
jgi:hypothetical protein